MGYAIGIDLGSTFSVVSYVNSNEQAEVIPNDLGERITPSVVSFGDEIYVGQYAVDMEQHLPLSHTIRVVKRHMGTNKRFEINGKSYSPEEISSYILKYLKNCAERFLGCEITDAVITVPAYFNNDQRQSTKTAGELAGLNVLRIINEPTAASLAYGLDKKNDATILVYDLGGGTFDVTLLKLMDGVDFHVQSTSGNTSLGGVDFDEALSDLIKSKLSNQPTDLVSLRNTSEKTKKMLSHMKTANVIIEKQQISISREEFEESIKTFIDKTINCVNDALRDANTKTNEVDEIVFVGGSTRIPLVEYVIEQKFGKKPNKTINPDEAVSIGASIQASVLSGNSSKEVYLLDVTPLSLGIETQGGIMSVLIPRNSFVPKVVNEKFTTAYDNQTEVDVKVFQGERPKTVDNLSLGQFQLDNIQPKPRGVPKIEVTFSVDANGILSVKAKDENSESIKEIQITGQSSLSSEEIKKILDDAAKHKDEDENLRSLTNKHDILYDCMIQIEELLRTNVLSKDDVNDLIDLKKSIEEDGKSKNLELLSGLIENCLETIKEKSHIIHDIAKTKVKI